jgi:DNA (cytosine-5)-methyltransferase 1
MLRELRPRIALFENVPGLLVSERGRFFNGILREIDSAHYECLWTTISAHDMGEPHLRKRIWIVAWFGEESRVLLDSLFGKPELLHRKYKQYTETDE